MKFILPSRKKYLLFVSFFAFFFIIFTSARLLVFGGSGTVEDPYLINTCQQLQDINNDLSAHYALDGDIDCSASSGWNSGDGFDPIGDEATNAYFTGSLDGRGYTVTGIYINRTDEVSVGLFGHTDGATITDTNLDAVDIKGRNDVGGLIGEAESTNVSGSSVNGLVEGYDTV